MKILHNSTLIALVFFISSCSTKKVIFKDGNPTVNGYTLEHRLFTISSHLDSNEEMKRLYQLIDRASYVCFNGIVLESNVINYLTGYNPKLDRSLQKSFPNRWNNLNKLLSYAKKHGMIVIPKTVTTGGISILAHDAQLAEALPVNNVPIIAKRKGTVTKFVNDPNDLFPLKNGNFNRSSKRGIADWKVNSYKKTSAFNKAVFMGSENGDTYIKIKDAHAFGNGHLEIRQNVSGLENFREYEIKLRIKTINFEKPKNFSVEVLNSETGQYLQHSKPIFNPSLINNRNKFIPKNSNWNNYYLTFNTLENTDLTINIRNWNGGSGELFIDYISIKPTLFQNVINREDTPITFKDVNGNLINTEKSIVTKIKDPQLGTHGWHGGISLWHENPKIEFANTNYKDNQKLLVSYFNTTTIKNKSGYASLTHPRVLQIIKEQLIQLFTRFNSQFDNMHNGWFFNHDELRIHGWDNLSKDRTPGENLIYNFNYAYDQAKSLNNVADIFVWNDMFDPYHNAYKLDRSSKPYYLVKGDWSCDLDDLPKDVIIANWIAAPECKKSNETILASIQNFESNGFSQIICGYYDSKKFYTKNLLESLESNGIHGIKGVMYTTWNKDYKNLEKWADDVWGNWCDF